MKPQFFRKVLKNGLTIIFEKRNLPVISVAIAVRGGGINEIASERGISHYVEHMLFKGTPTRNAKKIAEEIEKNGGDLNGFTEEEITAYFCKMPSKHLYTALKVLTDMIKNPLFDKKEMEKERKVIFEEIKMIKDTPSLYVLDAIQKLLYSGILEIPLIGTINTMNSIDKKKILGKFESLYQPNNIILAVVGDADFKKIVDFAERNFGNKRGKVGESKFLLTDGSKIEKRKGIDQANLIFAYHVPLANDKKNYAAQLLNVLMAGGMSSRLFSEIREKRNLAYAVKGNTNIHKEFAYNLIYVGTMKGNVGLVKKIILDEFEKVAKNLTEKELNESKEQLRGNYQISMEDSRMHMVNLLYSEIEGNAKKFYEFEKKINEVKLKDVKELADKARKKYSFFALVPD